MKKKWIGALLFLVILVIAVSVIALVEANTVITGGSFDLKEYEYTICEDSLPDVLERGTISDAYAAAKEADEIWKEVYGKEFNGKVSVMYDEESACWLVCGDLSLCSVLDFPFFPNVILTEEGTVVAVFLGQV